MNLSEYDKEATEGMIFMLLDFEEELEEVRLLSYEKLKYDGWFFLCRLFYEDGFKADVPLVYYEGQNWIFTPSDWQGWLPTDAAEIEQIGWRVNNTTEACVIFDGQPMLAPWADEIKHSRRNHRQRLGAELKAAREAAGKSIREVESETGVSKSIICRTEAGRANTTIDTIFALCDCYGVTWGIGEQIDGDANMN